MWLRDDQIIDSISAATTLAAGNEFAAKYAPLRGQLGRLLAVCLLWILPVGGLALCLVIPQGRALLGVDAIKAFHQLVSILTSMAATGFVLVVSVTLLWLGTEWLTRVLREPGIVLGGVTLACASIVALYAFNRAADFISEDKLAKSELIKVVVESLQRRDSMCSQATAGSQVGDVTVRADYCTQQESKYVATSDVEKPDSRNWTALVKPDEATITWSHGLFSSPKTWSFFVGETVKVDKMEVDVKNLKGTIRKFTLAKDSPLPQIGSKVAVEVAPYRDEGAILWTNESRLRAPTM